MLGRLRPSSESFCSTLLIICLMLFVYSFEFNNHLSSLNERCESLRSLLLCGKVEVFTLPQRLKERKGAQRFALYLRNDFLQDQYTRQAGHPHNCFHQRPTTNGLGKAQVKIFFVHPETGVVNMGEHEASGANGKYH